MSQRAIAKETPNSGALTPYPLVICSFYQGWKDPGDTIMAVLGFKGTLGESCCSRKRWQTHDLFLLPCPQFFQTLRRAMTPALPWNMGAVGSLQRTGTVKIVALRKPVSMNLGWPQNPHSDYCYHLPVAQVWCLYNVSKPCVPTIKTWRLCLVWWHRPVGSALGKVRPGEPKFKISLGYKQKTGKAADENPPLPPSSGSCLNEARFLSSTSSALRKGGSVRNKHENQTPSSCGSATWQLLSLARSGSLRGRDLAE